MNAYESEILLHQYLLFHYGSAEDTLPYPFGPKEALNFPVRTVTELIEPTRLSKSAKALDLGCAVGRSTLELARFCPAVLGLDFSRSFIETAQQLALGKDVPYLRHEEGNVSTPMVARFPWFLPERRIHFMQGDAENLIADWTGFDVVHAANLLCRLPSPHRFLSRMASLVKPGGQLLLAAPCSWLEDFTPRENWPEKTTRAFVHEILEPHFICELEREMPFLIREHARKFQWSVALGARWRRKDK